MKKLLFLFVSLLLTGVVANADETLETSSAANYRGYGKSFIFNEQGIEFSVFADGQFDFYIPNNHSNVSISIGSPNVNISFNTGYDYSTYVQYDEFGAVIQVENTPVFYDYYGRVRQIGDVCISYNNRGYITRVGGLYVNYRFNRFYNCTGFINTYNRRYVYRPWHSYYVIPSPNYCVVYNRPYRQYYTPTRYVYDRPYRNNIRRRTAVASRRGNRIVRNSSYASRRDGRTIRKPIARTTPRTRNNTTRTRSSRTRTQVATPMRSSVRTNSTRTNRKVTKPNRTTTRPKSSSVRTRTNSTRVKQNTPSRSTSRTRTTSRSVTKRNNKSVRTSRPSSTRNNSATRSRSARRI